MGCFFYLRKGDLNMAKTELEKGKQIKVFCINAYESNFYFSIEEQLEIDWEKRKELRLINSNGSTRILKEKTLIEKDRYFKNEHIKSNTVLMFESALSRELGVEPVEMGIKIKANDVEQNKATRDLFVIRFFGDSNLNKKLICEGFIYNAKKYIYLTSSAGQIRNKKGLFIKESLWIKHKNTLLCGLTEEVINDKGGMISNKYLAYMALFTSSTVEWEDFNIDSCVLVDDFETKVEGIVDYIDSNIENEKFGEFVRKEKYSVPISHSDGCGMIDINICDKAFSFRLPWFKGLLIPVDFKKFAKKNKITELNGKSIDEISIIFTKSQFKTVDFYDDFAEYQSKFKENNCKACKCIVEKNKEEIRNSQLSYQILQTLTDITNDEIEQLVQKSNTYLDKIGSDPDTMIDCISKGNESIKNIFKLYPNLLSDKHIRDEITNVRLGIANKSKYGKLKIDGKYVFIVPDVYAWMEYLFLGEENPKGILEDGKVSCSLFENDEVLDCVRNPHCYREHGVNTNVINNETRKWFETNCLYTSCHSLISKLLQFDVDGDFSLVINDKVLVPIAEKNMKDIVPLYYEMPKGKKDSINAENIFDGLEEGFKSKGIAEYSDSFTKAWNFIPNEKISKGDILEVIKYLCLYNNFAVDFAKTLYKPDRKKLPENVKENLKQMVKKEYPYFFRYKIKEDKDKKYNKSIRTDKRSTVDRLDEFIQYKDISPIEDVLGKDKVVINKLILMCDGKQKIDADVTKLYNKINKSYYNYFADNNENTNSVYSNIREILRMGNKYNDVQVCDMLIKSLFRNNTHSKKLLFMLYANIIENNLLVNLKPNKKICRHCGEEFSPTSNRQLVCMDCKKEVIKEKDRDRKKSILGNTAVKKLG